MLVFGCVTPSSIRVSPFQETDLREVLHCRTRMISRTVGWIVPIRSKTNHCLLLPVQSSGRTAPITSLLSKCAGVPSLSSLQRVCLPDDRMEAQEHRRPAVSSLPYLWFILYEQQIEVSCYESGRCRYSWRPALLDDWVYREGLRAF